MGTMTKARSIGYGGMMMLLAAVSPSPSPAQVPVTVPDVDEVMDYIDDLYRSQSSYSLMRMTVVRERGTRELEMEAWSKGDDEALIVIRSPAREAGAATLRTERVSGTTLPGRTGLSGSPRAFSRTAGWGAISPTTTWFARPATWMTTTPCSPRRRGTG